MSASLLELAARRVGPEALVEALTPEMQDRLPYEWRLWARPQQLPPTDADWLFWMLLAGRGYGKTRTSVEWGREQAHAMPGSHGAIVGATAADVRDVMVKELIARSPPWEGCVYEPSKRRVSWANGSTATLYSAEEPNRLRGPQHHWALADELAAWAYVDEVWDMLMMTMRLGERPRVVISTTPRPLPIIRRLMKDPGARVTTGSTYDNSANLSAAFIEAIKSRYDGTRLGQQEIYARVLDDVEGALWSHGLIDQHRRDMPPTLKRLVVAVDPSGSAKRTADEAGIVVAGIGDCPCLGRVETHAFVLEDKTGRYSPRDMGTTAIAEYYKWKCDRLIGEDNFGGKLIEDVIHLIDPRVSYRAVHASRGKLVRAEPIAALYEQGKVHHVGMFKDLEDEMCQYAPLVSTESPGRLDAMVWAITDLMLGVGNASFGTARFTPAKPTFSTSHQDPGDEY